MDKTFAVSSSLMYHRIADTETDPWGIVVSPKVFESQLQHLVNNYHILPAAEVVENVAANNITQNTICLTFDDGYEDNFLLAKPLLEKYNCPATFFIPMAYLNNNISFWWDDLESIFLYTKQLPETLSLTIADNECNYILPVEELSETQWQQHKQWKWYLDAPTARCAVFFDLWKKLRVVSFEERNRKITFLKDWSSYSANSKTPAAMNTLQLQELAANPLFTIGMHTHTHPDLAATAKEEQEIEILLSKKILEHTYGITTSLLAYPYGSYNNDTINIVKQLHIKGCFTTEEIAISGNADMARLGRYQVFNWDENTFEMKLQQWTKISLKT